MSGLYPHDVARGRSEMTTMAKRDLYDILGIRKTASADEIKAAHRKLVRKFHPDVNKGDKSAEEKFKEVQYAYDVLSDNDKRTKYDQFGHAGIETGAGPDMYDEYMRSAAGQRGAGRSARGPGPGPVDEIDPNDFGNGQFNSIFESLFGARGPFGRGGGSGARRPAAPTRGADVEYPVTISFTEAARGTSIPIQIARGGRVETIEIKIPAGVKDSGRVRVKGRGDQVGNEPGDLFIIVTVRAHDYFRRDGLDVILDLPLSLWEALEGTRVTVPTLDGPVELSVPPGTNSGAKLRIRERGIHRGQEKGDQLCVVKIVLPKNLSEHDQQLLRELAGRYPMNVRSETGWHL